MTTALDIVKRSMRLIGALGAGETPVDYEQVDGLAALNAMLESWSTRRLTVPRIAEVSVTWPADTASRTIGPAGADTTAERPIKIIAARQRQNDIDYPITVLNRKPWDSITDKTTASTIAQYVWYDPTHPTGTVYLWPIPSAEATILLRAIDQLTAFSTATQSVSLPPGYERALAYNLALELAPEYQREIPASVARLAASSLRDVHRVNHQPVLMHNEIGAAVGAQTGAFNWLTGD